MESEDQSVFQVPRDLVEPRETRCVCVCVCESENVHDCLHSSPFHKECVAPACPLGAVFTYK